MQLDAFFLSSSPIDFFILSSGIQYCDKCIFEIYADTIKAVFKFAMSVDEAIPNGSETAHKQSAISLWTDEIYHD